MAACCSFRLLSPQPFHHLPPGGLDFSAPVKKFFYDPLGSGRAFVNCVVSLTGFALVGGPARQDAPKAVEALKVRWFVHPVTSAFRQR